MPDMQHYDPGRRADAAVMQRLRSLPQRPPPDDGWPRLAAALAVEHPAPASRRGARMRWPAVLAMAAMLMLALLLPRTVPEQPGGIDATDPVTDMLVAQSQWLEQLVAAPALLPDVQDSDQVLLDLGLRQRIGDIDSALQADGSGDGGTRQALWQARVDALSQLVQLRWASRRDALDTGVADGAGLQQAMLWSN